MARRDVRFVPRFALTDLVADLGVSRSGDTTQLTYGADVTFYTIAGGATAKSTDNVAAYIDFELLNGTSIAYVGGDGSESWIGGYGNSIDVALYTNNSGGSAEYGFRAVADGDFFLYRDGVSLLSSFGAGSVRVVAPSGSAATLRMTDGDGELAQMQKQTAGQFIFENQEDGAPFRFRARDTGATDRDGIYYDPDSGISFNDIGAGVTPPTYTPSNVTTDRTYDANSTTLDEVADVLGTLIADLQAIGLLQ